VAISDKDILPVEAFDGEELARGITSWVELETPSERNDLIDRLLDKVESDFEGLPIARRRIPAQSGGGGQLVLTYAPEGASGNPVTFMGHIDTVWPPGTLAERPVRRDGDKLYGPGIFDMKAGSYLATKTLHNIASRGLVSPRPVVVYLNGDEETGSYVSRSTIEALAEEAAFVLVPEPSFEAPGTVITARKGVCHFTLTAHGRSAHAGGSLTEGRNAIREIARHTLEIEALTELEPNATFNVGVISGGMRNNVVPDFCRIEVDMRALDTATAERMVKVMLARKAYGPDIRLEIDGRINRPPFERTVGVARLYDAACALAARLSLPIGETHRGGASDGNFVAALDVPVLDGLGCSGAGAHALHEHILVSTIAPRAALMYGLAMSKDVHDMVLG
jgi:glutamate carboxypeptidase